MKLTVLLGAAATFACVSFAQSAELSPQETERRCHDYTLAPDAQIAACTPLLSLYGDKIETLGLRALAHLARATAYRKKSDAVNASADFTEAIRLDGVPLNSGAKEPLLLNDRCWARAIAMIELDAALADCNEAMRLRPGFVAALDSRAFLRLKQGQFRDALTDYDSVLMESPMDPYSLYGRGVTKLRLGDAAGGNADIAAALPLQTGLREEMAAYGVTP